MDVPKVGGRSIPALLYVDDTVLIARTAKGLQRLLNLFIDFMNRLDLSTNFSKSHVMRFGTSNMKTMNFIVDGHHISQVDEVRSLGVQLDSGPHT